MSIMKTKHCRIRRIRHSSPSSRLADILSVKFGFSADRLLIFAFDRASGRFIGEPFTDRKSAVLFLSSLRRCYDGKFNRFTLVEYARV